MTSRESDHIQITPSEVTLCFRGEKDGAKAQGTSAPESDMPPPAPSAELPETGRDARGRVTAGNTVAMKNGARSIQVRMALIKDRRIGLAADRAALLADMGGPENVGAIKAGLVERFLETSLIAEWLGGNLLVDGVLTGKGKARAAATLYLQVLDRLQRLAAALGMERQAKQTGALEAYRNGRYRPLGEDD